MMRSNEWKEYALNAKKRSEDYSKWADEARQKGQAERLNQYTQNAHQADGDALFYEGKYQEALDRENAKEIAA